MALWEWAAAGAVFVAMVVFCARFMKRGLTTLEDERAECLERIRQMEEKIKEDQKNMASGEHLCIARAGLEDLLRLAGNPAGMWIEVVPRGDGEAQCGALVLHLPEGELRISLSMRERELRGVRKVAHGRSIWHLSGLDMNDVYTDLVPLMRAVSARLGLYMCAADGGKAPFCPLGDPAAEVPPELPHLARRFTSTRPVRPKRQPKLPSELERSGDVRFARRTPGPKPAPARGKGR